ncbi:MAG: NAD-dependent epimerase/dehydratase family protein, partial [Pseudomonadota bacterium]
LQNRDALETIFADFKPSHVINLAAQAGVRYSLVKPHAYIESNITGFLNILECCRHFKIAHLIYASSSSVYGMNKTLPSNVTHHVDHPISLYAASKKSNELMAHTYSHLFQIPTTGLRFFTVYGPWGRPDMALFLFARAIMQDRPITIFNHGKMRRDFTYIDDIVEGIIKVSAKPAIAHDHDDALTPDRSTAPFRLYNIGNGRPVELLYAIELLERALGKTAKRELMAMQPGDVAETAADISAISQDFGFSPATNIEAGIERFVDWYQSWHHENA